MIFIYNQAEPLSRIVPQRFKLHKSTEINLNNGAGVWALLLKWQKTK